MSPFSKLLRELRLSRGYQQKELAHRLGFEQSYWSAIERSEKGPPRKDFIDRLIKGLDLNDQEISELYQAHRKSRRQLVLPARASEAEYALIELLEPRLGHLLPAQIQLIELVLRMDQSPSDYLEREGVSYPGMKHGKREANIM